MTTQNRQAAESSRKKKGISLDELQRETEKLLSLLNDRQEGLISWNMFMREQLQTLHRLTSQALGIDVKASTDISGSAAGSPFAGLFVPASEQLQIVRQRNIERGWGFTDADFTALGEPPAWPESTLSAVILDVSLDTVERTFEEAWRAAASLQPGSWRWDALKSDPDHLRLLPGITHRRGLRWRVVDLAANWDRRDGVYPADVCNPATSPHSAVLWAASYFPNWIQAMDGNTVPYVWIPGYQVNIPGYDRWSRVPRLVWIRIFRRVKLNADDGRYRFREWAVPALRE